MMVWQEDVGIPIRNCKAFHAYTKGTIEKFHQIVDSFLAEVALEDIKTLEELNALWEIYLEENYHTVPHSGLEEYYKHRGVSIPKEGITPEEEWKSDSKSLEYLNPDDVRDAFLHKETRKVRKDGFISFRGYKYFVSKRLQDKSVEIHFEQNLEKDEIPQTLTCFDSNNNKIEAKIMVADGDIDFEAFREAEEEAKKRKEEKEKARKSNANGSRVLRAIKKRFDEKKAAKAKNPALPEEGSQPIDPTGEKEQTPEGVSKTVEAQQEPLEEREEGNGQGTQGEPAPLKLSFASYHLDDD